MDAYDLATLRRLGRHPVAHNLFAVTPTADSLGRLIRAGHARLSDGAVTLTAAGHARLNAAKASATARAGLYGMMQP